ncbi:MAG: hypothetical protein A3F70_05375 [Acidobacteria bacterium RIFCSPLOWO2_12_FULL_67_14]|nr:MAG: hypothetical protein A3H29_07780 [Acidobacteria bacterium RIFCSPLOWO2_02_FULL_67_21]OFW38633.1 MAG: hypothetical protein A3F70_05375 [Acidobacteria bacterium RIFCSPLOWO2_12_FULL_67_14]
MLALLWLPVCLTAQGGPAQPATSTIPRTADGKPDLSGLWQVLNTAAWDIQPHAARKGVPGGVGVVIGGDLPYQPWALEKRRANYEQRATLDPEARCHLPGVPRLTYTPLPFQIVQTPKEITVLYEYAHAIRYIFMDSPHPKGPIEWWLGDSRGRWEGDSLVVDVVHFQDGNWFDRAGNFHSEVMHLVERYTPMGPDHIRYDLTVEDAKVFTRPWNMSMVLYRHKDPGAQLLDYECYAFDIEQYYPYPEMRGVK